MFFKKKSKGITVEDVLIQFSSYNATSMLDIPFRTAVTADIIENYKGGVFNLVITMMQNGITTNIIKSRPGSASLTYSAVNIHALLVKVVPVYNQKKMLRELYDVLPIMAQRFVLYIQKNTTDYQTLMQIVYGNPDKKDRKASPAECKLLDNLTDFICDFDDVHASTPAFKHLISVNILSVLNYNMKTNTKMLKSLL